MARPKGWKRPWALGVLPPKLIELEVKVGCLCLAVRYTSQQRQEWPHPITVVAVVEPLGKPTGEC
jgi:hypothetical protein